MLLIGLTGSLATGKSTVSNLLRSPPYNLPIIDADVLAREVVEPGTYGYRRVVEAFGPSTPDLLLPPPDSHTNTHADVDVPGSEDGDNVKKRRRSSRGVTNDQKREEEGKESNGNSKSPSFARPINRAALGRRVFGSTPTRIRDRKLLNSIIHPLVRLAIVRAVLYHWIRGQWAVLLDIPLLYESGLDVWCGVVVMVAVRDERVQMRRLRERDKALSEREAEERVGSQMGVGEKVERTGARGKRKGKVVANDGNREDLEREVSRVFREVKEEGGGQWRRVWLWGSPLAVVFVGLWEVWRSWRARKAWEREHANKRKA